MEESEKKKEKNYISWLMSWKFPHPPKKTLKSFRKPSIFFGTWRFSVDLRKTWWTLRTPSYLRLKCSENGGKILVLVPLIINPIHTLNTVVIYIQGWRVPEFPYDWLDLLQIPSAWKCRRLDFSGHSVPSHGDKVRLEAPQGSHHLRFMQDGPGSTWK